MIDAIVLAAGRSQRMGKPKPLLRFDDTTFLERIIAVLGDSHVDRITVVLGAHRPEIQAATDLSQVSVVVNEDYDQGQLSSLVAAIKVLPADAEAILLCLVDSPFITVDIINLIADKFRQTQSPIVIPVFEGERGHPVLFARSLFEALLNAPPEKGARHVVYSNEDKITEVDTPDKAVRIGVNTPEDYRLHFGIDP